MNIQCIDIDACLTETGEEFHFILFEEMQRSNLIYSRVTHWLSLMR